MQICISRFDYSHSAGIDYQKKKNTSFSRGSGSAKAGVFLSKVL
jgi:hypothetical protein